MAGCPTDRQRMEPGRNGDPVTGMAVPPYALPPEPHHTPEWVEAESKRLYPLDLVGRLEWLDRMAWNAATPADRSEILRLKRRLRGM